MDGNTANLDREKIILEKSIFRFVWAVYLEKKKPEMAILG
jgi:hypothetical protein